ncbi:MAG: hypothetical protein KKD33_00805, partial [Verrucomicrobia bacterium]|nr:hypothetical protein [Verrucomicrobiota bacterium]
SAAHIGDTGMEMIKDYCKYGGNLLVLGGPFAYGNGGYKGTALDEILPVLSQGPFDLKAVDGVMKWTPGQKMIKTGSLDALKPGYIHYVKVKPAAKVLLTCGEDPFLVAGAYGDGTVMCITGTPLGSSDFCNTPQWQEVLANILDYSGLKKKGGSGGDK